MSARDSILARVRTALGRIPGEAAPPPPELPPPPGSSGDRISLFTERFEALGGHVHRVRTESDVPALLAGIMGDATGVASEAGADAAGGLSSLTGIQTGIVDPGQWRSACASAAYGITGADYALADTGTLVLFATPQEPRLASLLPPNHIAILRASRILSGLDELFQAVPDPASIASSMVLITGTSRTADIEQILVRGVHGPGEVHAVIVETAWS